MSKSVDVFSSFRQGLDKSLAALSKMPPCAPSELLNVGLALPSRMRMATRRLGAAACKQRYRSHIDSLVIYYISKRYVYLPYILTVELRKTLLNITILKGILVVKFSSGTLQNMWLMRIHSLGDHTKSQPVVQVWRVAVQFHLRRFAGR